MKAIRFLHAGIVIAVIASVVPLVTAHAGAKKDFAYLRSEDNLRDRVEKFCQYMSEKRFKNIVHEFEYSETKKSRRELKEETEDLEGEAVYLKLEYTIETIKVVANIAYVFLDITFYPEGEQRWLDIWIFHKDNWYRKASWPLSGDACKEVPVIFSDIEIDRINFTTVQITWETDEEVESKIKYKSYRTGSSEKTVKIAGLKRRHEMVLTKLEYDELYDFTLWAKKDGKECHSFWQHFRTGGPFELIYIETFEKFFVGKKPFEIVTDIDKDITSEGTKSIFIRIDGDTAQKIADDGGYVFSFGYCKCGTFAYGIVGPEIQEIVIDAKKRGGQKKPLLVVSMIPWRALYVDSLYDFTMQAPRYYVERTTLSDIAKKHGMIIKREEDVIEWLTKN